MTRTLTWRYSQTAPDQSLTPGCCWELLFEPQKTTAPCRQTSRNAQTAPDRSLLSETPLGAAAWGARSNIKVAGYMNCDNTFQDSFGPAYNKHSSIKRKETPPKPRRQSKMRLHQKYKLGLFKNKLDAAVHILNVILALRHSTGLAEELVHHRLPLLSCWHRHLL